MTFKRNFFTVSTNKRLPFLLRSLEKRVSSRDFIRHGKLSSFRKREMTFVTKSSKYDRSVYSYKNFTLNITYENSISYVNCFNSTWDVKILYVDLIFIHESSISYVKYMFCVPRFHMWNSEPVHFTCELGVSFVKMLPFQMWNENFMCENVPILDVFHVCDDIWNFHKHEMTVVFSTTLASQGLVLQGFQ